LHGLTAAIDFQNAIGRARIEERDRALTKRLRDALMSTPKVRIRSATHPEMFAAVTTFGVEGRRGKDVQDALWSARVRVREVGDDVGVRCGTHLYVHEDDIDRIVDVVRAL
jgi:selenocysteine lyase/cysteine desulfurase